MKFSVSSDIREINQEMYAQGNNSHKVTLLLHLSFKCMDPNFWYSLINRIKQIGKMGKNLYYKIW
jgi:hypothetical protein